MRKVLRKPYKKRMKVFREIILRDPMLFLFGFTIKPTNDKTKWLRWSEDERRMMVLHLRTLAEILLEGSTSDDIIMIALYLSLPEH